MPVHEQADVVAEAKSVWPSAITLPLTIMSVSNILGEYMLKGWVQCPASSMLSLLIIAGINRPYLLKRLVQRSTDALANRSLAGRAFLCKL